MTSLRHRVLVHLADEGTVEHAGGKVTSVLADALDCTVASRVGVLLRTLADEGLVDLDRNRVSGRTFRARLTPAGRAAIRREGHNGYAVVPRREVRTAAPMPLPGPMTTVRFDPDTARERALGGVA